MTLLAANKSGLARRCGRKPCPFFNHLFFESGYDATQEFVAHIQNHTHFSPSEKRWKVFCPFDRVRCPSLLADTNHGEKLSHVEGSSPWGRACRSLPNIAAGTTPDEKGKMHMLKFQHFSLLDNEWKYVCAFGAFCPQRDDDGHCATTVHLADPDDMCVYEARGDQCHALQHFVEGDELSRSHRRHVTAHAHRCPFKHCVVSRRHCFSPFTCSSRPQQAVRPGFALNTAAAPFFPSHDIQPQLDVDDATPPVDGTESVVLDGDPLSHNIDVVSSVGGDDGGEAEEEWLDVGVHVTPSPRFFPSHGFHPFFAPAADSRLFTGAFGVIVQEASPVMDDASDDGGQLSGAIDVGAVGVAVPLVDVGNDDDGTPLVPLDIVLVPACESDDECDVIPFFPVEGGIDVGEAVDCFAELAEHVDRLAMAA